ncbi:MAG: Alkaline phosphatase synthesis sensor protein PhoR [Flavobacteriaceae bacterium]|nr:MAG: Alkaline phosphatase synthesis sensor protein PhoR [Flavobacteriaceae bacterium]
MSIFRKYRIAIQISLVLAIASASSLIIFFKLITNEIPVTFYVSLVAVALGIGALCFGLIYFRIEKLIEQRVQEVYKNLSPVDSSQLDKSIASDVTSITNNLQKKNTDQHLEIELLKEREAYRKEFIGNIAHELKTPLFTIQGYILTLLDGGVKDKKIRKKYLNRASKGVERLIFIIRDLDLITQFEAGIQNLSLKKFDLIPLINNVFDLLEMQASKRKITIKLDKPYEQPIWVHADEERIMQVITNLIVNSLKYGVTNGTTELRLSLKDDKVLVTVTDNGEGIEEDHLPRLFERFYRVDKSGSRKQGGSGLGLSIVKHIIDAHKEKLFVNSKRGIGSEFSFSLTLTEV